MMNYIETLSSNAGFIILIKILISVAVCCLLILFFKNILSKLSNKSNGIHIKYFNSLIKILLVIVEIYYLLNLFDATRSISTTILGGGAVVLAVVSFGAQQAMGNVISGLSISASKPYELNDKIKVVSGGSVLAEGMVKDITIRHTVVETFDGQTCIIPNSIMDTSVIINTTYTDNVGNFLAIEISYESDVDKAMDILKRLVVGHDLTLNDDSTSVSLSQLNDNGLLLKTTVWTKTLGDNFKACSDIRIQVLKAYKEAGITIPYNTIIIKQ